MLYYLTNDKPWRIYPHEYPTVFTHSRERGKSWGPLCSKSSISSGPRWDLQCSPQAATVAGSETAQLGGCSPLWLFSRKETFSISPTTGKSKGAISPLALPHFYLILSYSLINLLKIADTCFSCTMKCCWKGSNCPRGNRIFLRGSTKATKWRKCKTFSTTSAQR